MALLVSVFWAKAPASGAIGLQRIVRYRTLIRVDLVKCN